MKLSRALPVFSIAFAALYVVAMYYNLPLATYYPAARVWGLLLPNPPTAPGVAMYWYGWLGTAGIGAALVAFAASFVPERKAAALWGVLSWLVPVAMILVLFYLLRSWFLR